MLAGLSSSQILATCDRLAPSSTAEKSLRLERHYQMIQHHNKETGIGAKIPILMLQTSR